MAKKCLMTGETEGIKFRYKGSEMDARELHFTEKQADAILAMRLSRLIGLEVDVLRKELADAEQNVLFGGRLAEYKYYDMHKVIEQAMNVVKNL